MPRRFHKMIHLISHGAEPTSDSNFGCYPRAKNLPSQEKNVLIPDKLNNSIVSYFPFDGARATFKRVLSCGLIDNQKKRFLSKQSLNSKNVVLNQLPEKITFHRSLHRLRIIERNKGLYYLPVLLAPSSYLSCCSRFTLYHKYDSHLRPMR